MLPNFNKNPFTLKMKHSNKKRYQLSKNKGNSQTKKRKSFSKTKITPLFREQADLVFHQGQLLWTFGVSLGRRRNIIDGATCVEIQKVLYLICIYVYTVYLFIYTHYMYTVYIFIYPIGTVESFESSISWGLDHKRHKKLPNSSIFVPASTGCLQAIDLPHPSLRPE